MTVSTTSNTAVCQGNGVTTSFSFPFIVPNAAWLVVTYQDASGVQTVIPSSQYSVTGIGLASGGSVTYPKSGSPLATGTQLIIQRIAPMQQLTSLINQAGYYPDVVEAVLDSLEMQLQQNAEAISRAVQVPVGSTTTPTDLINQLTTDAANAATNASNAAASATAAAASQSAAASSASSASSSASSASSSASTASSAASSASTSASNASTSATNAASSATSASSSATAAASSQTAAASSASSASSSASAASSSASSASSSASSASTSATNAAASASAAAANAGGNVAQQEITVSESGGALTITFTPQGPLTFRNPTLANGAPVSVANPGPLSITLPVGATLGAAAGQPIDIGVSVSYNGGSCVLNAVNLASGIQWDGTNLISPTTVSAGATSANTIYSESVVSANSPYLPVGVVQMPGQTTAGTWAAAQTQAQGATPANAVAMGTHGLINNTGASSDLALPVDGGCYLDFTSQLTVPLHVACGDYQELEITGLVTQQASNTPTYLLPNNASLTNQFHTMAVYGLAGTPESQGAYTNGFQISNGQALFFKCILKTDPIGKLTVSTYRGEAGDGSISTGVISSLLVNASTTTPDTTSHITSAGTLSFGAATSGRIIIRRKA